MLILLRDRKPHLPPAQSFYDTAALWPATHEYGIEMNHLLGQLHVDQSSNHLRSFTVQAGHGWGGSTRLPPPAPPPPATLVCVHWMPPPPRRHSVCACVCTPVRGPCGVDNGGKDPRTGRHPDAEARGGEMG